MQKTKKVVKTQSARQPAIRSAKPTQTSSKTGSRKRKPLTKAQRERKNAHDRAVRAEKRASAAGSRRSGSEQPELREGQVYSLERALPLRGALPVPVGTVFTVGQYLDSVETFDFGVGGTSSIPHAWIAAALKAGCLYLVDDPKRRAGTTAGDASATNERAKRTCSRPGEVPVPETPCNAGRTGCSTGTSGTCGDCGPSCGNYGKCRHLARTSGFPRLHRPGDAAAANGAAAAARACKDDGCAGGCSPAKALGEWVRESLSSLDQSGSGGVARKVFQFPGGVAEVSVCRRACEYPRRTVGGTPFRMPDPLEWFTPDFWSAVSRLSGLRLVRTRVSAGRAAVDFNDGLVREQARRGLTWFGEEPDLS